MLIVVSPTLERMLDRAGARATMRIRSERFLSANAPRGSAAAVRHDGRSRRRPAGGDVGARISARRPRGRRARGPAADRADPGPGRRADRRAEPGWRLALGQRRPPAPAGAESAGRRRATGSPRRRSSGRWRRPSRWGCLTDVKVLDQAVAYLNQEFAKLERQRSRDPRRPAARAQHPPRGQLRGGQQPEPRAQRAVRPGAGLPGAHLRQSGSGVAGRRADRHPGPAGQDRGDRAGPAVSRLLGQRRPVAGGPRRRRDDGAGHAWPTPASGPQAPELDGAVAWLLAHRVGDGWQPHKAKGPALAALASYYGRAAGRRGPVPADGDGQRHPGRRARRASARPRARRSPCRARRSRSGSPTASASTMEGRGRFGYAVTLAGFTRDFGPDQDRANRVALGRSPGLSTRRRRSSTARCLPVGFGVAVNPTTFENLASQVGAGRQGPRRPHRLAQHPLEHARMGARLPDRRGAPARRHDPDRRLGADVGHLVSTWPTACSPSTSRPIRTPA